MVDDAPRSTGTATCRASGRVSATATACTARTTPEGHRFNPQKLLIDPYAKAIEGGRWDAGNVLPYAPSAEPRATPTTSSTTPTPPTPCRSAWSSTSPSTGRATRRRPPVVGDGHLRDRTSRASPSAMEAVREDLRGTYAGMALRARDRPPQGARRHRGRVAAASTTSPTSPLHENGLTNHRGTSTDRPHLRRTPGYSATGSDGEQVREFKGMVKALHRDGIR